MINIKKIRDLYIASDTFNTFDKSRLKELDYEKWKDYINSSILFVWYEDTEDGKNTLNNIDKIPDDFRESVLSSFDNIRCYANFISNKKIYNIGVIFHKKLKRITISFEKEVTTNDLKLCLDIANYLDAYLLYNGNEIIDEKVIESLE